MRAEIVAVGTELLLGDIVNGNAAWLGQELSAVGIDLPRTAAVGDNIERIAGVIGEALGRADAIIVTGGLGPTPDDLTREALCRLAGVKMTRDAKLEQRLLARYATRGAGALPANNLRMADLPAGASPLPNSRGTAPGIRMEIGDGVVYALPGVPAEMRELFREHVRPDLLRVAGQPAIIVSRVLRTVGIWESKVAELLADLDRDLDAAGNPTLAYLVSEGQTRARLTAKADTAEAAAALLAPVEARARAALGDVVFGTDTDTLEGVAHAALLERGATVAAAESLTGGLLGAALTATPGASATYRGGVVAYATDLKAAQLGVPAALLAERGAVDPDVAAAMAVGARERFGADFGLATTGVAGPDPQDGVPVGTVYVAIAGPDGANDMAVITPRRAAGGREQIRHHAVLAALDLLRRRLLGLPLP